MFYRKTAYNKWKGLLIIAMMLWGSIDCTIAQETSRIPEPSKYGKREFFGSVPGTVAFLNGIKSEDDADEFISFRLLPESGNYILPKQSVYWFVVNHRIPSRVGEATYIGIDTLSFIDFSEEISQPTSMYRNKGWTRKGMEGFARNNNKVIGRPLAPEKFFLYHVEASSLVKLDELLGHPWHGDFSEEVSGSYAQRMMWDLRSLLKDASFRKRFNSNIPDDSQIRVDAMLIKFKYTDTKVSDAPVVFWINGANRIASYVRIFSHDNPDFERHFYFTFTSNR